MAAPTSPILDTHTLDLDPPHALSSVERWTCTRCGCAVLVKGGHVYGSASAEECGNPAPAAAEPVDTSPAGTLHRAAAKLRTLAEAAVPGPWAAVHDDAHGWTVGVNPHSPVLGVARIPDCAGAGGDARYIAAMHPSVGATLAAWLEVIADRLAQRTHPDWQDTVEPHAYALALAVLGEQR